MPVGTNIPTPPQIYGEMAEQIAQLHTYLYRLSEQLDVMLSSLESPGTSGGSTISGTQMNALREQLRQMISNTAKTLQGKISALQGEVEGLSGSIDTANQEIEELKTEVETSGNIVPSPTEADAGKILMVNNTGAYELTMIPSAESAAF